MTLVSRLKAHSLAAMAALAVLAGANATAYAQQGPTAAQSPTKQANTNIPGRETAEDMLRMIGSGAVQTAYATLTDTARKITTREQFADLSKRIGSAGLLRVDWKSFTTHRSAIGYRTDIGAYKNLVETKLYGTITTRIGVAINVYIEVQSRDGAWRVNGIEFKSQPKPAAVQSAANAGRA